GLGVTPMDSRANEGARRSGMSSYVMLTTLTPETVKSPADLKGLEKRVAEKIRHAQIRACGHWEGLRPLRRAVATASSRSPFSPRKSGLPSGYCSLFAVSMVRLARPMRTVD